MKRIHLIWGASVLLQVFLFLGCKTGTDSLFPNTISLKGKMLSVGDSLGWVNSIEAIDGYLIFTDEQEQTLYTILKPDLPYCFHFGRVGQGPGEMLRGSGVMMIRNGYLTLSDGYKLYQHSLDSLYSSIDHPIQTPNFERKDAMVWVTDLADSLFVATGTFPNGKRFKFLDNKGTPLAYVGDYPLEEHTNLPYYIVGMSFLSMTTGHPTVNRFALGTQYGGVLDVLEWEKSDFSIKRIGGICEFKPRLTSTDYMGTPNFAPDAQTRWGYFDLDSDESYIYALYSGKFVREENSRTGNVVHVFDWEGMPVCQINLDMRIIRIAVVKNKLYALYEDADIGFEVIEYVLPDNLKKK